MSDKIASAAPRPADPPPGDNIPEFSVSELSQALKRMVEGSFGNVRLRGELSGVKRAGSYGHIYMTLKDADAVIDAICWKGTASRLSIQPEDGMEVIARGRLTTYPGRSKYQIIVDSLELAGEGALLKMLEDRRKKLAAEGLFDPARKRSLPFLPRVIGVVTSPTGAVIRDILHRLADRFPRHVLLAPVIVQGEGASAQVAAAIAGFNNMPEQGRDPGGVPRPDVLIVARGGGSLEDLWAFNEEIVVRAAATSDIPLISAVGHETDTTLIDYAADKRAPTPTAAAEMAVPVRADLYAQIVDDGRRLTGAVTRLLDQRALQIDGLSRGLPDPRSLLDTARQRVDDRSERLINAVNNLTGTRRQALSSLAGGLRPATLANTIDFQRQRLGDLGGRLPSLCRRYIADATTQLTNLGALLNSYSYERVLDRGFVLVRDDSGQPLLSAKAAKAGAQVTLSFRDGDARAAFLPDDGDAVPPSGTASPTITTPKKRATRKAPDDGQGTLL